MKRVGILLMVLLVGIAVMVVGCGGNENSAQDQNQIQGQQQSEQQNRDGQNVASPTGAKVQNAQSEVKNVTLNGVFNGLADGHSAEIAVDGEATVFQFYDEAIAEQLEIMETGTIIQFDVETDDETGVMTIVKLYTTTE
jgi:ABC-type oligopeptide transport system substrate-binding subunit